MQATITKYDDYNDDENSNNTDHNNDNDYNDDDDDDECSHGADRATNLCQIHQDKEV